MQRPELAVSDSTTCRAVASGSPDCELPGHRRMSRMPRHRGKRRRRRGTEERRVRIEVTRELSERPPEASRRSRLGGWEGDAVAGRQGAACLVTLVDRTEPHAERPHRPYVERLHKAQKKVPNPFDTRSKSGILNELEESTSAG